MGFKEIPDAVAFSVDSAAACDAYHFNKANKRGSLQGSYGQLFWAAF